MLQCNQTGDAAAGLLAKRACKGQSEWPTDGPQISCRTRQAPSVSSGSSSRPDRNALTKRKTVSGSATRKAEHLSRGIHGR
jgi:hypothetical protein